MDAANIKTDLTPFSTSLRGERDHPLTSPSAEPFFFPGNATGCLLVHGFTGTPKEMRPLGEFLAGEGFSVLGIRLAGHATSPADMVRMRWWDWLTDIEDGLNLLKNCTKRVFIMGLSMGASLALLAASRYPCQGVVSMAGSYSLEEDWRLKFLRPISIVKPRVVKSPPPNITPMPGKEKHVSYGFYPTRAVAELYDLLAVTQKFLPELHQPVLLIHGRQDETADPQNMPTIYQHLGSQDKQMLWLENSSHVITYSEEREIAFNAILAFIHSHLQEEMS